MVVKLIKSLIILLGSALTVAFFAVFSGTIVWLIWPVVVPAVFPGLIAAGTIAAKLTWWVAVCLTWLASILIKSSCSNKNK